MALLLLAALALTGGYGWRRCHEYRRLRGRLEAAEAACREQERRLRLVVGQAPLVLFAFDAAGVFTTVEGRGLAAVGLAPRDLLGRSLFAVFADAPQVLAVARRALAGEEFTAVTPLAAAVFETRHTVLRDERGAVAGVVGVALDVSERAWAEAELASCHRQLDESREAERLRLAHALHDGAVQELVGIRYSLMASQGRAEGLPAGLRAALHENQERLLDVIAQLRGVIGELRPAGLDDFGLPAALEEYVAALRREAPPPALAITLDVGLGATTLPPPVARGLFRVAQEALRNALAHAQARQVTVTVRRDVEGVDLCVRDDGRGFVVPDRLSLLARRGHFGLLGLAERAAWLGGRLDVASAPGAGTTVTARIPLRGGEGADDRADPGTAGR